MALLDQIGALFPKQEKDTTINAPQDGQILQPMQDEIKKAKFKGTDVDRIFELVGSGKALPGTIEFAKALGIEASQHGIIPSGAMGPFGPIRDMFSPTAQELTRKQAVANKIGTLALGQVIEMRQRQAQGPQNLQEAQQLMPGVIQPVEAQRGASLDQLVGQGMQGPTQVADPGAALTPAQQKLAAETVEGLGRGSLMRTSEGVVPTQFAGIQGRMVTPEQLAAADTAAITPPNQPLQQSPVPLPATLANEILQQRGRLQQQLIKPPDVSNLVDEISLERFDRPFRALTPDQRKGVRATAETTLQDRQRFQQEQIRAGQLSVAGPVATMQASARAEVEKDQPVDQPQLWRDPVTGIAAKSTMTTRQAQKQNFVKLRPDQIETLNQMETIDKGLAEVKEISKRVLSPQRKTPLGETWRAMTQSAKLAWLRARGDADMLKMDSIITRLTAPLVKSQGDTANIAVAEREMFAQSLVNNRASSDAVIANLDNVISTTKSVRKMMGFSSKEDFETALKASGMKEDKAKNLANTRFPEGAQEDMRGRIRELRTQGKSYEEIEKLLTKGK